MGIFPKDAKANVLYGVSITVVLAAIAGFFFS